MVARGRNSTSDNHCAIDRSICVRWPWCVSISCEEKYPRHIQANWFALFVKTTLSLHYGGVERCTPTIHELVVSTLPPRHRCPLDRLPASRLLLQRSGLERSDFVL